VIAPIADQTIPFDVAGNRTIHVDHHDLDSVARAKSEIIQQIRAVERDPSDVDEKSGRWEMLRSRLERSEHLIFDLCMQADLLRQAHNPGRSRWKMGGRE